VKFETVGELRAFLRSRAWSPEQLAAQVGVSNMTWRRLLARRDAQRVPDKYRAVLERHFAPPAAPSAAELDPVAVVLSGAGATKSAVLSGIRAEGAAVAEVEPLVRDVEAKARKTRRLPARLSELVVRLIEQVPKASNAAKALILGGLLYFLNPLDLVADAILGIGFVDDLGVLVLIRERLKARRKSKAV
jgi:uncharacterized membrane protein YkvA (DUF1232 family)